MKKLIQHYTIPQVDKNILTQVLKKREKEQNQATIIRYLFLSMALIIFIQHFVNFNISYLDIFVGVGGAINIYLLLFINIFIGVIHFIVSNPFLIMGSCFIYFLMNIYILSMKQ